MVYTWYNLVLLECEDKQGTLKQSMFTLTPYAGLELSSHMHDQN